MRLKSWWLPLLCSLAGTLLLWREIDRYKKKLGYGMALKPVLLAARAMPEGEILREQDLSRDDLPERYLPVGSLLAEDMPRVKGRTLLRPAAKGELLLWSAIDLSRVATGPSSRIPNGYRALALSVDAATAVAHAIQPGDRIDLLATTTPLQGASLTFTLLQNITVLSIGSSPQNPEEVGYDTVTLMLLPREVPVVEYAKASAKLSLALRHPEDPQTSSDLPLVSDHELLQVGFRNSLQQERNGSVEILRGGRSDRALGVP